MKHCTGSYLRRVESCPGCWLDAESSTSVLGWVLCCLNSRTDAEINAGRVRDDVEGVWAGQEQKMVVEEKVGTGEGGGILSS